MSTSIGSTHRRSFAPGAAAVAVCVLAASCGGTTEVASSTVPATTESAASVTTAPPSSTSAPTTVPPTSAPPATSAPPTTVALTTVPATTAPPATTAAPETTSPPTAAAPKPTTAYVTADDQLLEVDVATGATVRVLDEFFSGEGVFRGGLRLSSDRTVIWYSEGYEDSWYSCEASTGSWGAIDAATGAIDVLGSGSGVEPSADGAFVSYVTSGLCLPDPENPEFFVLTPGDRVVVRDLATGDEREFVTDTAPADYASPSAVRGASFSPDGRLLVLMVDGRLFGVDIDGSSVIQDHPLLAPEVQGDPVSAVAGGLLTVGFGDEGSSDLFAIDATSGAPTLLASSGAFMAVGVSAGDHVVVSSFEPITVAEGADVTVLELPGDPFVFDLDW